MSASAHETYQIVKFESSSMPFFFRIHRRSAENRIHSANVLEHWHKGIEINYICKGPTEIVVDGTARTYSDGDICLINSGSIHSIRKKFSVIDNACDAFTIIIDYEFLKILVPDLSACRFELTDEAVPKVRAQMERMLECYQRGDYQYRDLALTGMVYELVFLLCEYCREEITSVDLAAQSSIRQICRIMEYVALHYRESFDQSQIAAELGFSREHFSRYFKQYTGITFREYLTKYRLKKAIALLEGSDRTEIDIALETGFSGVKQMSEAFKRYYDMTPGQYRKSLRSPS